MGGLLMYAQSVNAGGGKTVVQLRSVDDPENPDAPSGDATIVLRGDEQDVFEEGVVYDVTFGPGTAPEGSNVEAAQAKAKADAEEAAIPNAGNTVTVPPPAAETVASGGVVETEVVEAPAEPAPAEPAPEPAPAPKPPTSTTTRRATQ